MTQPEHAAWRPTADTITDFNFLQYREMFIHETPKIKRFLTETRAEHFIISAPKGFGKTLLLIAKRMQVNEHSPELARGGEIVDRPLGSFRDVGRHRMDEYRSDFELWSRIWSFSIMVAAINASARTSAANQKADPSDAERGRQTQLDRWTQELLSDRERYRSPTVIFTSLLDLDYTTRQKALSSLNRLSVLLADVQSQVAFFIDNVDEYFAPALENQSMAASLHNGKDDQRKSNEIWINAQLALIVVAFQLHRGNHHIRVYCTIRKEAYLKLHDQSAEYSQISGCTVEISYNKSDLKIIFEKNVKLMNKSSVFLEASPDHVAMFFGSDSRRLRHRFVNHDEDAFEYVLRHTFYRPRDLMTICGEIAMVAVDERNPARIREVVDLHSADLVHQLFSEMKPFFRLPDLDEILSSINRNTLTRTELEIARTNYMTRMEERRGVPSADWEADYRHPFCMLYQIGMLGWIQANQGYEMLDIQRFVKPHDIEVGKNPGLPPTEMMYLIHPALDHMIFDRVGGEYFRRFHREAIIGADLAWHGAAVSLFVIKGDVCGFSRVMATEFYQSVSLKLHEWARTACEDLDYVEVANGDSITLIDRSADKIVDCVLRLIKRASAYKDYPLSFRFGGAAGPVTFGEVERRLNNKWEKLTLPFGQALRNGARLEPHAPRGKLMVDNSFIQAIGEHFQQLIFDELRAEDVPSLFYNPDSKVFHVQKSLIDPVHETRLYIVRTTSQEDKN